MTVLKIVLFLISKCLSKCSNQKKIRKKYSTYNIIYIMNDYFEIISDAHKGMAVAGALALGLSAVIGIGFALAKNVKK